VKVSLCRAMSGIAWLFFGVFFHADGVLYSASTLLSESIQSENISAWYTAGYQEVIPAIVADYTNVSVCGDDCWLSGDERNCDTSSADYMPHYCEYDVFVGDSVCPDEDSPPYPLEGVVSSCSTSQNHEIDGFISDDIRPAADLLFRDYLSGASLWDAWTSGDSNFTGLVWTSGSFRAYNILTNLTFEETTLGFICFEPWNSGNMVVDGSDDTVVLFVNVTNVAGADYALRFNGGTAHVFGGLNNAIGPIDFSTSMPVKLWGLVNYGTVSFSNSQDIMIMDTINANGSLVSLTDVEASLVNITNNGTVFVDGGKYAYFGGENNGNITVQGSGVEATFEVSSNSGNISAFTGTFDVTIGTNTGLIYGASGVAGTITILLSNTGTIDVPSTVTVSIASMSSEVLEQTFTVTGVSVDVMNMENRINFLEAEIASALSINWIYVSITSITEATTRRLGLLSKQQRRLTTGVDITYQVSFSDATAGTVTTVEAAMNEMADDPTGETGAQVLASISSSTGMEGLSMVASTADGVTTTATSTSETGTTSATDTTTATTTEFFIPSSLSAPHIQVDLVLVTMALSVAFA